MWQRVIAISLLSSLGWAQAGAPEANIPALLNQVMHQQRVMNKQLTEYTAASKSTNRRFNDKGERTDELVLESESYQSSGRNVEVVLRRNGKPLSAGKIEQERQAAVKALTEDEAKRLAKPSAGETTGTEFGVNYGLDKQRAVRLSTFDIFRACVFSTARRTDWNGRAMIVLDFQPRPNYQPPDHQLTPLAHLAGTVWIDAKDLVTAKLAAFLAEDKTRATPAFTLEYSRQPDGMWLNTLMRLNTTGNPAAFNGVNADWMIEKSNYQRFTTQAEEAKITVPKQ